VKYILYVQDPHAQYYSIQTLGAMKVCYNYTIFLSGCISSGLIRKTPRQRPLPTLADGDFSNIVPHELLPHLVLHLPNTKRHRGRPYHDDKQLHNAHSE